MTALNTATVTAEAGDTLDALIWRTRGLGPADLPEVLDINPGLAALGALLPAGREVLVPVRSPVPALREIVQLWD